MKENGNIIRRVGKEDSSTQTETSTREHGSTIKPMGMVCIQMRKGLAMRATGKRISSMGGVLKLGRRGLATKATTKCPKRRVSGSISGPTGQPIAAFGQITKLMAWGPICGKMDANILASGQTMT